MTITDVECHPLFATSELLRAILLRVDEPKTLARCSQVNREWHNQAIPILWRGSSDQFSKWRSPDISFFVALIDRPNAFHYYVSFIDKLVLVQRDSASSDFDGGTGQSLFDAELWSTLRASMVLVDIMSAWMTEDFMSSLIQPSVKSLYLFNGHYSDTFVYHLKNTCALRLLLLDGKKDPASSQALKDLIDHIPLEYVELENGYADILTGPVLCSILNKPTIKHVSVATQHFGPMQLQGSNITSSLRSLEISSSHISLQHLFQYFPNLERLRITRYGNASDTISDVLRFVTSCKRLLEFQIFVQAETIVLEPDLLLNFAQNCPLINRFSVEGIGDNVPVDADKLVKALCGWKNLIHFTFELDVTPLNGEHLTKICQSCPKLTDLSILADTTTSAFYSPGVLFPRLLSLDLNRITIDYEQSLVVHLNNTNESLDGLRLETRLLKCMPQLRYFDPSFSGGEIPDFYSEEELHEQLSERCAIPNELVDICSVKELIDIEINSS